MDEKRIALLQQMAFFGGVRAEVLALLLDYSREASRRAGEFFFREGETGDFLFVLERGRVQVLKSRGQEQVALRELGPGECFGEMALIDLSPRSASVLALEDCLAIEVSLAGLHAICERDIEQFALIEMNIGRELSRRLRICDARLVSGPESGGNAGS
ncbi:MAG: cyclic nucleotide-binding domain-containing protein [Rhodocyclaceae bacterium]